MLDAGCDGLGAWPWPLPIPLLPCHRLLRTSPRSSAASSRPKGRSAPATSERGSSSRSGSALPTRRRASCCRSSSAAAASSDRRDGKPHYDDECAFAIQSLADHVNVTIPFMDVHLPESHKRDAVPDLARRAARVLGARRQAQACLHGRRLRPAAARARAVPAASLRGTRRVIARRETRNIRT